MYMRYYVKYQYQVGSLWSGGIETVNTTTPLSSTDVLDIARRKIDVPEDEFIDYLEIKAFEPIDEELKQDDAEILPNQILYVYRIKYEDNYNYIDTILVNNRYCKKELLKMIETDFKHYHNNMIINKIEILSEIELDPDQKYVY